MPCGKTNIPAPKLLTSLPDASKWKTVSNFDISPFVASQHELALQRSATQMVRPSLSMSTALVEPHVWPSGSLKMFPAVSYGFGRSLVGCTLACAGAAGDVCACRMAPSVATLATAASVKAVRRVCDMALILSAPFARADAVRSGINHVMHRAP